MFSSNEFVPCQSTQPVAVEVDGGGVHRDELGDVGVAPLAAVDDAISIILKSFVDNEYFFIGNKVCLLHYSLKKSQ
jgi:hypothetical protein